MKPFASNAPNAVKMQVYHCTPPINRDQFGNWSVHPAFALLCRHRSGFLRKPTRDNLCAQAATALCGPGGMRRTVRCGGQGRAGDQHAVAVIMRSAFLEGVGRHDRLFEATPPTNVWQFSEHVVMHKGKLSATGSTATAYCWLIWHQMDRNGSTYFSWIPPCRKRFERPEDYA